MPIKNDSINLQEDVCLYKKLTSSLTSLLRHYKDLTSYFFKLLLLDTLGIPDYCHQKQQNQLLENFMQKAKLSLTSFMKYYKDIANLLFWVFWACLDIHTKNKSINVKETLLLSLCKKNNLIPFFFLEMLHFKESCNLISQEHMGQNVLGQFGSLKTRILTDIGLVVAPMWFFILDYSIIN